jgi:hypothetical protein
MINYTFSNLLYSEACICIERLGIIVHESNRNPFMHLHFMHLHRKVGLH